jgi:hypothetical protein
MGLPQDASYAFSPKRYNTSIMQEAKKTTTLSPQTLEESQALIASLLQTIQQHESLISEKDALIATQA